MLPAKIKYRKKKPQCFADLVTDVPKIVENVRKSSAYDCLDFLGSGSYGKCFEFSKRPTNERFACKILSKSMLRDNDLAQLIQNEIRIHRKLKHEHVVEFIESFEDTKHVYMVQTLCPNQSLRELAKSRGKLSVGECRYVLQQILEGTQYIHDRGVIHRDLKLTNVLIDSNMQMKIADFGLAICADDRRLLSCALCGTTNYLAPEVIEHKGFRLCSDIWAIGVIGFQIMFGYKPFDAIDLNSIHERISRVDYSKESNMDPEFKTFIRSVFVKNVEHRLSATQCLQLDFFVKHDIPREIPVQAFSRESFTETKEPSCILQSNFSFFEKTYRNEPENVEYPTINALTSPRIKSSFENFGHVDTLQRVYSRFDAICRFHEIECGMSISDFSNVSSAHPDNWVTRWTYDRDMKSGFQYQIADGSIGLMFYDGTKLLRTPDDKYWYCMPGGEQLEEIVGDYDKKLDNYLQRFEVWVEIIKQKNGHLGSSPPYTRHKMVHLYAWEHTDEAMVMLLSDSTLQINFSQSHKKMLIHPKEEMITFFEGQGHSFMKVSFAAMASHGFSVLRFVMFKYVTAIVQRMAQKLQV